MNRPAYQQEDWLYGILIWLLLLCAVLFPVSLIMTTVWDGQDVDWMGVRLIAAGPRSELLRDFSTLLFETCCVLSVTILAVLAAISQFALPLLRWKTRATELFHQWRARDPSQ